MNKQIIGIILLFIILAAGGVGIWMYVRDGSYIAGPISTSTSTNTSLPTSTEEMVRVFTPKANGVITSPVSITGEAKGRWYFEASFPIHLRDANGRVITTTVAEAQDEWMTESFVPFVAKMAFAAPETETGVLVFQKDNPSGLPEYDAEVLVPVRFVIDTKGNTSPSQANDGCRVTGCSGQVCADADVVTDCLYKPEYQCYRNAVCERGASGRCSWRDTAALRQCLASFAQK